MGGECSYYACIPSKSLLRPGEAVHAARSAAARAEVDVDAVFAWRDFMVSNYSDAGQQQWLASAGIDLLRGSGRLAGPGVVEVAGARYTAENVVLANGADPFIPPVPGLRELDGIWTNREATGMKAVPRRLLVLGGGPVGVEMAQAVRRFGGEVALVERELVGGECSYYACIPSKTLLRPGEAVWAARDAVSKAEVDVEAALAWRDFMVSNYSDAGQERWLANNGIDLLRGSGRLAGTGVVEVGDRRYTAENVVQLREMGGTFRIAPALTTTREELQLGLEILDQALGEVAPRFV